MPHQFRARLASIRITPSRSEDANDVSRFLLEAHDLEIDPIRRLIDQDVYVTLTAAPPLATPLEDAIASALVVEPNGAAPTPLPSAGRRRRGTHPDPTEGE